jgi:hypothetical protein
MHVYLLDKDYNTTRGEQQTIRWDPAQASDRDLDRDINTPVIAKQYFKHFVTAQ